MGRQAAIRYIPLSMTDSVMSLLAVQVPSSASLALKKPVKRMIAVINPLFKLLAMNVQANPGV